MPGPAALTDALVVCVDFGTACCGYTVKEPGTRASATLAFHAPGERQSAVKTPSDVAFDTAGGRLQPHTAAIAGAALKKAAEGEPGVAHFSRYKMRLYDPAAGPLSAAAEVRASDGSAHPLLTVVGRALGLVRADAVRQVTGAGYNSRDIRWVVTVPAMARDEQLAFMRRAAIEAGMVLTPNSARLALVAEPEAACAYMLTQPMMVDVPVGATIAVLDCGGGTHDFVALRLLGRDPFKAEFVCESEGGAGGAADVNEAFYREMSRLVSRGESDTALRDAPDAVAELWQIAEAAKQQLNEALDESMLFDLSFLVNYGCVTREGFGACIEAFNARLGYEALEPHGRTLRVRFAARFFRDLVLEVIRPIEELARDFLARTRVDHVVAVGGFAESRLLQERLQAAAGAVRLLVPPNPSTCVARGGIQLMGAQVARVCPATYGVHTSRSWAPRYDVPGAARTQTRAGELRCSNVFDLSIARGTAVRPGWRSKERVFCPTRENVSKISFRVFRSADVDPVVTAGQTELGTLDVEVDEETYRLPLKERRFGVAWTWEREIAMLVTRKRDGHQWRMRVDTK